MGLDFIGNPYEQDELGDSDFEITGEDDWITLPNDMVILENRDEIQNVLNTTFDMADSSDDDTWPDDAWPNEFDDQEDVDDPDDEDYNPDDEDYEADEEAEDVAVNFFFNDTDFDTDDDEDDCDYVTMAQIHRTSSTPSETIKTTPTDTNTNSPDNADAD